MPSLSLSRIVNQRKPVTRVYRFADSRLHKIPIHTRVHMCIYVCHKYFEIRGVANLRRRVGEREGGNFFSAVMINLRRALLSLLSVQREISRILGWPDFTAD